VRTTLTNCRAACSAFSDVAGVGVLTAGVLGWLGAVGDGRDVETQALRPKARRGTRRYVFMIL
jgi:hypothetical protein